MRSVTSNGFSFEIIKSRYDEPAEIRKVGGASYVSLPHKCEYKVRLYNDRPMRCDAHIYIDGVKCGVWRIPRFSRITIERPVDEARKFVFLAESSGQAASIGAVEGAEHNGLVKVVFKPEYYTACSKCAMSDYEVEQEASFFNNHKSWNYSPHSSNSGYGSIKSISLNAVPQSQAFSVTNHANYSSESYFDSNQIEGGVTGLGRRSNVSYRHTDKLDDIDHDNITTLYARLVVQKRDTYSPLRPLRKKGNKYPVRRSNLDRYDRDDVIIEKPYYESPYITPSSWLPSFNFLG